VEQASRELALRDFDAFATTEGFMQLGEEALASLLGDDRLSTEAEELVYEGVVRWTQHRGGDEGEEEVVSGLLRRVRFPWMEEGYLTELLKASGRGAAGLDGLVREALTLKGLPRADWEGAPLRCLGGTALAAREGGVRWEKYVEGGERRVAAGQYVYSVAVHGEHVCGGLADGSIRVWGRATLGIERTLTGHTGTVLCLVSHRGRLVSGSLDYRIRVCVELEKVSREGERGTEGGIKGLR
jgi:hypothetical protein